MRLLAQVAEIEEAEKDKMRTKCKKIIDHGVNVFVNRQLIYNFPEQVHLHFCLLLCACACATRTPDRATRKKKKT